MRIFILSLLAVVVTARLGGWESADPKGPEVLRNIIFALQTRFPDLKLSDFSSSKFKIVDVKKQVFDKIFKNLFLSIINNHCTICCSQVVAGLLYDVVVDFTPPAKACQVLHFQIGDRFGKLSLLVNEALTNACTV